MEQDGWVTFREEQEGNRPPRRVYKITPEGATAFQMNCAQHCWLQSTGTSERRGFQLSGATAARGNDFPSGAAAEKSYRPSRKYGRNT